MQSLHELWNQRDLDPSLMPPFRLRGYAGNLNLFKTYFKCLHNTRHIVHTPRRLLSSSPSFCPDFFSVSRGPVPHPS